MSSVNNSPNEAYYNTLSLERYVGSETPSPTSQYKPSPSPRFDSPYGPFPATDPALNVHAFCFPPSKALPPTDYDLFIDSSTSEALSIHAFYARVCALARALRHDGLNPLNLGRSPLSDRKGDEQDGEVLGIISRNALDWPVVAQACFRSGVVFGGISPHSTVGEMGHVLGRMGCTGAVVSEDCLGKLEEVLAEGRKDVVLEKRKIIVLCEDRTKTRFGDYWTIEGLVREGMQMKEDGRIAEGGERLCFMFQSSGTSGLPKAMMITHRNAVAMAQQTLIDAKVTADFMDIPYMHTTVLGVIPCYHSYGCLVYILSPNLSSRTTIMLLPKWNLEHALQAIQKYRITTLPLVPQLVRQLAQSPLTSKYDLSSVMIAGSGAAYLPPDVATALGSKLPQQSPVGSGYGMSEAASISRPVTSGIFGLPSSANTPNTVGYLLPGMSGRIVDPETLRDVPRNTPGEMWVRGLNVTPGYYRDAMATAELFTEPGWLRTGDLCSRDDWDQITYLDRCKELIKVKGLQVAPTEIEDCLLDMPGGLIRDACVVGVVGEDGVTVLPRAWVVLSDKVGRGEEADVFKKAREWVSTRLSRYKWLDGGIERVDEIPRTPSGKMLRREMRDRYEKRSGRAKL